MSRVATLAAGRRHSLACRDDGTVASVGNGNAGECDIGAWRGIISVAAGNVHAAKNTGRSHSVGLRADGTVLASGWNEDGQCDVSDWSEIQSVAAGWRTTLGVRRDGTVVAVGRTKEGQRQVAVQRTPLVVVRTALWSLLATTSRGSATWRLGTFKVPELNRDHRRATGYRATVCYMDTITHRELRNNSAEVLRRVESGETLQVTNNGKPAAIIGPAGGTTLDDLIARGHARPARGDASSLSRLRHRITNLPPAMKSTSEMIKDARGRW